MQSNSVLSEEESAKLLSLLKARFVKNMERHAGIDWEKLQLKLENNPGKLYSLRQMEDTGGEPDVVGQDPETGEYIFFDCSAESPKGRRSVCYDREGQESRKEHKPRNNALDMAESMGAQVLNEDHYRALQDLGTFDSKTSSWLETPLEIRKLGGAIFGDYRYNTVFIYHNGASSYYGSRGFRCILKV